MSDNIQQSSGGDQAIPNLQKAMFANFSRTIEMFSFIAKAEAINQSMLTLLTNKTAVNIREEAGIENDRPAATSTPKTSAKFRDSNEMICHDCGKVFLRNSLIDSITKHLKETACKPYQCRVCKKLFKRVS